MNIIYQAHEYKVFVLIFLLPFVLLNDIKFMIEASTIFVFISLFIFQIHLNIKVL